MYILRIGNSVIETMTIPRLARPDNKTVAIAYQVMDRDFDVDTEKCGEGYLTDKTSFLSLSSMENVSLTDRDGNPVEFVPAQPTEDERLQALENAMLHIMMGGGTNG